MKTLATEEEGAELAEGEINEETGMHYGNLIVFSKRLHLSLGPDCKEYGTQTGLLLLLWSFLASFPTRCIASKEWSTLVFLAGWST